MVNSFECMKMHGLTNPKLSTVHHSAWYNDSPAK